MPAWTAGDEGAAPSAGARAVRVLAGLALLALASAAFVWFFRWDQTAPDVTAYWRAASNLRLGLPVYAPPPPGPSPKAFLYPPTFAALLAPLTALPPLAGYATWMALHFLFLAWLVRAAARAAGIDSAAGWTAFTALLLAWLPAAVGGDFQEGQVNLLLAALVASALACFEEKRDLAGGVLLALAAHVKILPAVLVLPLLLQGRRRAALATVVAGIALVLLPALYLVPQQGLVDGLGATAALYAEYLRIVLAPAVANAEVAGDEQFYILNNSLVAVLHRIFGDGVAFSPFPWAAEWTGPLWFAVPRPLLRVVAVVAGLGLLGVALLAAWRSAGTRPGRVLSLALCWIAVSLASLNCWEHHLVFVALLLAPLAGSVAGGRGRALVAWSVFVLALWTGPYLAATAGWASAMDLLAAGRAWGLPTLALLGLFALSLAGTGGEGDERVAGGRESGR